MKEIGGYFELELNQKEEYHSQGLRLNSGRNCLLYILQAQKPSKIFLPYYICDSILEPIISEGIKYELYNINESFEITSDLSLKQDEKLLYVNYFGLKSVYSKCLAEKYTHAFILDNTQAFFEKPLTNIDTIYSPRKFFGVSDGGYLYTHTKLNAKLEKDESIEFSEQLLGRQDKSASHYYKQYQKAEHRLVGQPIKSMSKLTQAILKSIDYEVAKSKRVDNFEKLHLKLKNINALNLDHIKLNGPMVYPFVTKIPMLREYLIEKKVYVARYWGEVLDRDGIGNVEQKIVESLVPLPIDQRYGKEDMQRILALLAEK